MSATYHLRQVSPSPSPTASTTDHYKLPNHSPPNHRLRRPLSPSSLRDVDLSQAPDMSHRKYPTPPTGHDLMAMFPPAPPDNFPEMRPGPTSGFFQRQERAFFAQAGKEIVRVRVEVDFPHGPEPEQLKPRTQSTRPWLNPPPPPAAAAASAAVAPPHHSPVQSAPPTLYPSRPTPRPSTIAVSPAPLFSSSSTSSSHHSPALHQPGMRTPPQDLIPPGPPTSKPEYSAEEYDDEAWKRPMPFAERRRAGKHTRRVIVRT